MGFAVTSSLPPEQASWAIFTRSSMEKSGRVGEPETDRCTKL